MTDVPETPDALRSNGAAEAPQSGANSDSTTPPWGDDFNPERAWSTIQNLRAREKELSPYEKQLEKLRSDDEAFLEFARERGFYVDTGEPVDDDVLQGDQYQPDYSQEFGGEPDPLQEVMTRQQQLEQWMIQQEGEKLASKVENHIDHLATEAKVELSDYERSQLFQAAVNVPKEISDRKTKQLFDQHVQWAKEREDAVIKRYLDSKRAPEQPPAGQAGEPAPDPRDDKARKQRIAARIQALSES